MSMRDGMRFCKRIQPQIAVSGHCHRLPNMGISQQGDREILSRDKVGGTEMIVTDIKPFVVD